jgi:hypothetical protein
MVRAARRMPDSVSAERGKPPVIAHDVLVYRPGIGRPRVSARRILVSRACVRLGGAGSGSTRAVASIASLPAANAVASELLL